MPLFLELKPSLGDDVCEVATEMIAIARRLDIPVRVRFNDALLTTHGRDRASQIVADYERWMNAPAVIPPASGG